MSEVAHEIIPFGKYKGQPVEVLQSDKQYCEWLSSQEWFQQRYAQINTLIINNFTKPEDTPEHNKLQALFLDVDFRISFMKKLHAPDKEYLKKQYKAKYKKCLGKLNDEKERLKKIKEERENCTTFRYTEFPDPTNAMIHCKCFYKHDDENICLRKNYKFHEYVYNGDNDIMKIPSEKCICNMLAEDKIDCLGEPYTGAAEFEVDGWDVIFTGGYYFDDISSYNFDREIIVCIEIKPCIGDDYPSVLRQMKTYKNNRSNKIDYCEYNNKYVLVYDQFSCSGATLDQVKKIFKASNIEMLSVKEIMGEQQL